MTRVFTAVLLFSLQMAEAQSSAYVPNSNTEASSLAQLSSQLMPKLGKVRFHREEELEDRLRAHGLESSTLPHIFQVQAEPSDDEALTRTLPTMYVAVSRNGSAVYELAGSPDAERHFDELVKDEIPTRIQTSEAAESRGLLCAQVVYGTLPSWWTDGESSVQSKAAQHFFSEGHQDGLALAAKWWKSAKGNHAELKLATVPKGDGFELSLPIFWAPVEGHSVPEVKLYRIEISRQGTCTMPASPSVVLR